MPLHSDPSDIPQLEERDGFRVFEEMEHERESLRRSIRTLERKIRSLKHEPETRHRYDEIERLRARLKHKENELRILS